MSTTQKVIYSILILVIGGVIGFFIAKGTISNQNAAIYNAATLANVKATTATLNPCDMSPTNPCVGGIAKTPVVLNPAGLLTYTNTKEGCLSAGGKPGTRADVDGPYKGAWPCNFIKVKGNTTPPGTIIYVLDSADCAKLGGTLGGEGVGGGGGKLWSCSVLKSAPTTPKKD